MDLLRSHYAIVAEATPLDSERDQNFLMTPARGPRLVLKLANPLQDQRLPRFQIRALAHIAQVDPGLPVPRVVPTAAGEPLFTWSDGETSGRLGYVVGFLEGTPLVGAALSASLAGRLGALAARLGRALRGFFDPAAGHELLWDLKHADRLIDLLPCIPGEPERRLAAAAVERFTRVVQPRLPALRAQVIHNDLNPHNLLVDAAEPGTPAGIIDFGDMVHGALVNDIAVAAAYLVPPGGDPFGLIAAFVAAYHAVTPLDPEEIALLPDLVATRNAMTCAIAGWRAEQHPDNAAYILRNAEGAVRGLTALSGDGRAVLAERLARACGGRAAS